MQQILTLSYLAAMVKNIVERQKELQNVWVDGEIGNLTIARSGHAYFNLKDAESQFRCVMWRNAVQRQRVPLREGDQVLVHGGVTMYTPRSELQLQVDVVQPRGTGLLQLQLEELRARLEAEGIFDPSRKRPLPVMPRVIGVVTAATGAVWHDIQRVVGRRYPLTELVLSPSLVQGDSAPASIVAALERLQAEEEPDVIIVGRGGGSQEDLWAFNDERVVRAIFAGRVPIISAVGHENDFTLADDAADVRAGTPSIAAELATPDLSTIDQALRDTRLTISERILRLIDQQLEIIDDLQRRLTVVSPISRLQSLQQELTLLEQRLHLAASHQVHLAEHSLETLERVLESLNPQAMFRRGFAFVENASTNSPIRAIGDAMIGDPIRATVGGGQLLGIISGINPKDGLQQENNS